MSFNITRNATKHKKLVVGTSTTVPADGDLHVDGNVGIGTSTFETWSTDQTVLQIGGNGAVRATTAAGAAGYLQFIQNAYYDSTNSRWEYRDTDEASMYQQNAGTHKFRVTASGTADAAITWTDALTIDSAGNVGLSVTPESISSTYPTMQIGYGGQLAANTTNPSRFSIAANSYLNTSSVRSYIQTDEASEIWMNAGTIALRVAPSGTADTAITWTEALTISNAGKTTFSPTGNEMAIYSSPAVTTDSAIKIQADSLTTGRAAYFTSNASGTENRELVWIRNDNAAATGTTCLKVTNDSTGPAISATGGIVETGGVLKSNLLSNSGFDCWSNSTLSNCDSTGGVATGGTELVTNGDFASASDWTISVASGTWAITGGVSRATAAADAAQFYQARTYTVGKLYKVTWTVSGYSAGGIFIELSDTTSQTVSANGTYSFVFEAADASDYINFRTDGTTTLDIDDVSLYEVTPGCVAADALAMDGWGKSNSLDIWRQHNDGGTNTKDGSFYALKTTTASTGQHVSWRKYSDWDGDASYIQNYAGRTVTLGAWVKTSTASHASLRLYDGTNTSSTAHTGGGGWEWLEVTKAISATAGYFYCFIDFAVTATDAYVSQPMLVFGSAIGSGNYSRPMGEIVWCDNPDYYLNDYNGVTVSSNVTINTESQTNGKVPKGARACYLTLMGEYSATDAALHTDLGSMAGYYQGVSISTVVANERHVATGWQACDSNGDYGLRRSQNFTDVRMTISGVELR